jgi:hypothetical protein
MTQNHQHTFRAIIVLVAAVLGVAPASARSRLNRGEHRSAQQHWTNGARRLGRQLAGLGLTLRTMPHAFKDAMTTAITSRRIARADRILGAIQHDARSVGEGHMYLHSNADRKLYHLYRKRAWLLRNARPGTRAHRTRQRLAQKAAHYLNRMMRTKNWLGESGAMAIRDGIILHKDRISSKDMLRVLGHERDHIRQFQERTQNPNAPRKARPLEHALSLNEAKSEYVGSLAEGLAGRAPNMKWMVRGHHPDPSLDRQYSPGLLNWANREGYLRGVRRAVSGLYRASRPRQQRLVDAYLAGYRRRLASGGRQVERATRGVVGQQSRSTGQSRSRNPLVRLYRQLRLLPRHARFQTDRARARIQRYQPVRDRRQAYEAGLRDASLGLSPLTQIRRLLRR